MKNKRGQIPIVGIKGVRNKRGQIPIVEKRKEEKRGQIF
jgi:hypothetical protein